MKLSTYAIVDLIIVFLLYEKISEQDTYITGREYLFSLGMFGYLLINYFIKFFQCLLSINRIIFFLSFDTSAEQPFHNSLHHSYLYNILTS